MIYVDNSEYKCDVPLELVCCGIKFAAYDHEYMMIGETKGEKDCCLWCGFSGAAEKKGCFVLILFFVVHDVMMVAIQLLIVIEKIVFV